MPIIYYRSFEKLKGWFPLVHFSGCGRTYTLMSVSSRFIRLELRGIKTGKSTGLDDVSTSFLKDGADSLIEPIKHSKYVYTH